MSDITGVIADLERQRDAIDRALSALRALGGPAPRRPGRPKKMTGTPATTVAKKRVLSPAGRKRIVEALKKRWAAKKAAAAAQQSAAKKAPAKKSAS